ncbi:MAG: cell division protein FtsX [Ignavibacteriaceae bacterium]
MFNFAIKESLRSIKRTKLAFFFSLFSMTIALLLIQFSLLAFFMSTVLEDKIKETFKINIFLEDNITEAQVRDFKEELKLKPYTEGLEFISKQEAVEKFIKETGDDFKDVLDYNPLPASFVLTPGKKYIEESKMNDISKDLKQNAIVTSTEFQNSFLSEINSHIKKVNQYIIALTIFLIIIAIYLIYSTLRLIIENKKEEIETMKLVGASTYAIKLPIILNGSLLGVLAGIITSSILLILHFIIRDQFDIFVYLNQKDYVYYYYSAFMIGPLLGWFISIITLRRVSLRF